MSDRQVNALTKRFLRAKERLSTPEKHLRFHIINQKGQICLLGSVLLTDEEYEGRTQRYSPSTAEEVKAFEVLRDACGELYPQCGRNECAVNNTEGFEAVHKVLDRCVSMSMEHGT